MSPHTPQIFVSLWRRGRPPSDRPSTGNQKWEFADPGDGAELSVSRLYSSSAAIGSISMATCLQANAGKAEAAQWFDKGTSTGTSRTSKLKNNSVVYFTSQNILCSIYNNKTYKQYIIIQCYRSKQFYLKLEHKHERNNARSCILRVGLMQHKIFQAYFWSRNPFYSNQVREYHDLHLAAKSCTRYSLELKMNLMNIGLLVIGFYLTWILIFLSLAKYNFALLFPSK